MTGKRKYYQREDELNKIAYCSVLFMRHYMETEPEKAKELCESLLKANMERHNHLDSFEDVKKSIDDNLLKLATKRFAYRIFELSKIWQEKARAEELKRQKEKEEVRKRVEAFKKKKVVVKVKKSK